ncbi:hypothetical protein [Agarivorans sp. QJM3NY_33]|uniref:hypothetical protein n=1 Tax=Agarivorans sp. QJM3NY_33 TaxID=3421432 RepID=UPI003D7C5B63
MTHTRIMKWAINAYVGCALLAWLVAVFSGVLTEAESGPKLWIFPLNFELTLVVLLFSLLAAYSLRYGSIHGRLLLSGLALIDLLNMIFTNPLVQSSLVSSLDVLSMLALFVLLYIAWTNTLADKVKRLQAYQHQQVKGKSIQSQAELQPKPQNESQHKPHRPE